MADYELQIGKTDGYRYIGVMPPLDEDQSAKIFDAVGEGIELEGNGRAFCIVKPTQGPAYSELGLNFTRYGHKVPEIANKIIEVLRAEGHNVTSSHQAKYIGFGRHLFGGQDKQIG